MFKRNIFSFLLVWIMLASLIVSPILQPFTVHAETNQEQENGIEYVNKKLGFSLTIPKFWEGKYKIEEEDGRVRFIFKSSSGKKYDIPPLFTISYDIKKEDGWNNGLRWMGELGTKGDMGYYYYYDALHLYRDGIPPGEEQDTILTMLGQIPEVLDSFKMSKTEEDVALENKASGDTVKEVKSKEQETNGGVAEEVTNQETANGIEYVNEELGFALTLPKFWKNHFIVEENDQGGVIFKFKYDGKVYDDIYLFNIYVVNKEYSSEEQEELGDNGVLGIKNGKTYLIAPNVGIYFYNNYDKYFPSVPKEGRSMIEAMSKQIGDIDFKVLTADEAKPKENHAEKNKKAGETNEPHETKDGTIEEERGEKYEFMEKTESHPMTDEAQNYDYYLQSTKVLYDTVKFRVIKTPIDNIRTEVIMKPLSETKYIGINGAYSSKGKEGNIVPHTISYYNPDYNMKVGGSTKSVQVNALYKDENDKPIPTPLPTLVTYYDRNLQKTKAEIIQAKSLDDIYNHFKNLDHNDHHHHYNQIIINAIGGKGFEPEHLGFKRVPIANLTWDRFFQNFQGQAHFQLPLPTRRTVLGFREENGTTYAYLMVTLQGTSIGSLKIRLSQFGFDETNCIVLDGSGSSSMRVIDKKNNKLDVDLGTEPNFFDFTPNANRVVYSMIRLIE
ncbi:hypothetical protein AALF16_23705 [Bacillus cereus]|uniref:hypothetical protein n=1 Tax=Bacillus cereus TaxID=1396 RepID=UPI00356F5F21